MSRYLFLALGLTALVLAFGPPAGLALAVDLAKTAREEAKSVVDLASGHEAASGHAAAEPNILEPQPKLAVWTLVVFVVLLLVLWKFAWGPLGNALHQREEHLERCLLDTERARNESEQILAEHRRLLAQAPDEVRAIIEEARRDAQMTADEILKKAQAEAEAARQRAEREIATARDQALVELWKTAANLAVSVAGKVLVKDLTADDQRRLFETAVASLPAAPTSANGHGGQHA